MGWFSDLYERGKSFVKNTVDSAKQTLSNWAKGVYTAPGGYKYCGPGNSLDEGEPKNASDALCRQHDIDYSNFAKAKVKGKELADLVRESDQRLISGLQKAPDRDVGSYLSEYGIRAKNALENWGIIKPDMFVTE
jgi:hypothetical protein